MDDVVELEDTAGSELAGALDAVSSVDGEVPNASSPKRPPSPLEQASRPNDTNATATAPRPRTRIERRGITASECTDRLAPAAVAPTRRSTTGMPGAGGGGGRYWIAWSAGPNARWLVVVAAVLVLSACGTSRDAGRAGTIPDITSPSTTSTSAPPTTAAPVTAAPTVAPTAAPVLATSLTTTIPPPTAAPTPRPPRRRRRRARPLRRRRRRPRRRPPAPTAPPVLATSLTTVPAPAPPTAVPPTPAPTAPPVLVTSLTTAPGPTTTTTLVVAPGEAPPCNADAIRVDTGVTIAADPVCRAGWAVFAGSVVRAGEHRLPGSQGVPDHRHRLAARRHLRPLVDLPHDDARHEPHRGRRVRSLHRGAAASDHHPAGPIGQRGGGATGGARRPGLSDRRRRHLRAAHRGGGA